MINSAAVDGTLSQIPAFYLCVKVTRNVAQYPLHHVTYICTIQSLKLLRTTVYEMHLQENTLYDLDLGIKVA